MIRYGSVRAFLPPIHRRGLTEKKQKDHLRDKEEEKKKKLRRNLNGGNGDSPSSICFNWRLRLFPSFNSLPLTENRRSFLLLGVGVRAQG